MEKKSFLTLLAILIGVLGITNSSHADSSYPPYPDVWRYNAGSKGIAHICLGKDKDVYIFPGKYYEDLPKTKIRALFAGTNIEVGPKEAESAWRGESLLPEIGKLECYGIADRLTRARLDYPHQIILSNGSRVEHRCFGAGGCGYPFNRDHIEIRDKNQRVVARRSFLVLYEKPKYSFPRVPSGDRIGMGKIYEQAEQIKADLISLDGETFLVKVGQQLLRVDGDFKTKVVVQGPSLFMVDTSLIEDVYSKLEQRYQNEKRPMGDQGWHQLLQDEIGRMLRTMKQGER